MQVLTIGRYLADDHSRLEALLRAAVAPGGVAHAAYAEFRKGLLRHIGLEEKILLPAVQRARGGIPLPAAARLRLEHGAIAALLVPTPTVRIVGALRAILAHHNALEEGPDGVYAACEGILGREADAVLAALRAMPEVRVSPHADGPEVMDAVGRALERAGYDFGPLAR